MWALLDSNQWPPACKEEINCFYFKAKQIITRRTDDKVDW